MKTLKILLTLLIITLIGCQSNEPISAPVTGTPNLSQSYSSDIGGYYPWGFWDFEIARDGSYAEVVPNRGALGTHYMWGYHMNVVKFLEVSPCTDCLKLENIHMLGNGDVSVDISLRHPFIHSLKTNGSCVSRTMNMVTRN